MGQHQIKTLIPFLRVLKNQEHYERTSVVPSNGLLTPSLLLTELVPDLQVGVRDVGRSTRESTSSGCEIAGITSQFAKQN